MHVTAASLRERTEQGTFRQVGKRRGANLPFRSVQEALHTRRAGLYRCQRITAPGILRRPW